jgi:hypothetical protein
VREKETVMKWISLFILLLLLGCASYDYEEAIPPETEEEHWTEFCMDAFHGISWMCNTNFGFPDHDSWEERILPECKKHEHWITAYVFCYELHKESCELIIQCVERNS